MTPAKTAPAKRNSPDESSELPGLAAAEPLTDRDVRSRRPPILSFVLRMETLRRTVRVITLLGLDLLSIYAAIITALALKAYLYGAWDTHEIRQTAKDYLPLAFLVASLLFARSGLYAARSLRPGLVRIVASLFQTMIVILLFAVAEGHDFSSYYVFYGTLLFAIVYVASARYVYERITGWLLRAAGYRRRTVLVGSGAQIEGVAHALASGPSRGVNVVGFLSLKPRPDNGLKSLGKLKDLDAVITEHRIEEVVIADSDFPEREAVDLVEKCHGRGVTVRIAPSTMEILIHRAEFVPGQSVPLFELKPPVFDGFDYAVKRTFDLLMALLLLIVLSPLLLLIVIAIKASSRGPILYRSMRPGIGGVVFPCLKFRTMRVGADRSQDDLEDHNEADGALFKIRKDPRLTAVGPLLRRFSLDELPQLVNVLRGEMSLVGPRPLPERDYERLDDWHKKRYLVLPGMTGLWQVSGRSDLDFDDLVRLDFLYLERWSIFLDLTILLKTLPAILLRRGAF
jgi:exopolysaccharide biosynthesis polyprenyl glycosylphosphotransferase